MGVSVYSGTTLSTRKIKTHYDVAKTEGSLLMRIIIDEQETDAKELAKVVHRVFASGKGYVVPSQ